MNMHQMPSPMLAQAYANGTVAVMENGAEVDTVVETTPRGKKSSLDAPDDRGGDREGEEKRPVGGKRRREDPEAEEEEELERSPYRCPTH